MKLKTSKTYEICAIYNRPNSRPVVGLSMATEINEIVAWIWKNSRVNCFYM